MKTRISQCLHHHTTDIDPERQMDSKEWDRLANVCVVRATTGLKDDINGYSKEQRDHISDLFNSMAAPTGASDGCSTRAGATPRRWMLWRLLGCNWRVYTVFVSCSKALSMWIALFMYAKSRLNSGHVLLRWAKWTKDASENHMVSTRWAIVR
jgi:hypothetical protein